MQFKQYYKNHILFKLKDKLNYKSIMQVPKIVKITLNMGVGQAISDKKLLENAVNDLTLISGQKPYITKAKKSLASFKIRQGHPVGCKVTLRNANMWNFFQKLVCIAIPRIRDFRGFPMRSFDQFGNYSIGIKEQIIFPEIDYDKIDRIRGLDITITTSAKSKKEGYMLLSSFTFPFHK